MLQLNSRNLSESMCILLTGAQRNQGAPKYYQSQKILTEKYIE